MPDELLTPDQIAQARVDLPRWQVDDTRLRREITAGSFLAGIDLVSRVAQEAERRDHHPDIDIRWRTVTFALSTHSSGGITHRDLDLAADIDRAAEDIGVN